MRKGLDGSPLEGERESMGGLGVRNGGYRRICLGRGKMGLRGIYYMRKIIFNRREIMVRLYLLIH